ncbi:MAG TPA: ATP synthase F1 subunit epsilon [Candidatus Binataceae bacterium]|nr:ATP synthase F1 subunit epsilon [Candidatus Binataceae bacterium]HVB81703.1 ATP synthase F1 subunit epsilon [Candidatus Binataceae bacterium]
MALEFPLRLVTPTGVLFEGLVREVDAVNPLGEFGVLADHINFITALSPGILTIVNPDGTPNRFLVTGGLVEVKDGAMTVLADEAEAPRVADEAELARVVEQAEEKLPVSLYDPSYAEAAEEIAILRARIHASQIARESSSRG